MSHQLVIVESPAKAKTIEKYLGKEYKVLASYGHVRDLESKSGAVDPAHDFAMKYQVIERNAKHLAAIFSSLKSATGLLLATDPDREGEAIAWSVYELAKQKKLLENKPVARIVFHEITKSAVQEALAHPRTLSMDLVDAQQARRALDYLVGFNLSPLLWRKIRAGLSAGRVQSPALRMIVEREEEIERFVSQEYWTIEADLHSHQQAFEAKLVEYQGSKVEQFTVQDATTAENIRSTLLQEAQGFLTVTQIEKKQRKRHPTAPFTTSTLQQEAARKLGFTTQRTMRIAQQLYEGIDTGQGSEGLISYMRTDSVNLANDAINEIRQLIAERYGNAAVPDAPRLYKTKSKNAQEAHEAIRPTSVYRLPQELKAVLSLEQHKLYQLIWQRTVACQMIHATIDTVTALLQTQPGNVFRASGSIITDPGFIAVYQEGKDDAQLEDGENKLLPPMTVGEKVPLVAIRGEQHFTEPPPRFSEASLVKALEEHGIGRPSTYAAIISTLQKREYVVLDKKRFQPTDVGRVVNRFLTQHFTQYVDYDFTAKLEDELDEVSRGEKQWIPLLEAFWQPFTQQVSYVDTEVKRKDVTQEVLAEACPECGQPLAIRLGKRGRFIGCTTYPECGYTRNLTTSATEEPSTPEVINDKPCPECGHELVIKNGRYGKFIGCSQYPNCKHMEPLNKPYDTGVTCPACQKGTLIQRKSRRGKVFYSCNTYPTCTYALWDEPISQPCPLCHFPITTLKITQRQGQKRQCPEKECTFSEPFEKES